MPNLVWISKGTLLQEAQEPPKCKNLVKLMWLGSLRMLPVLQQLGDAYTTTISRPLFRDHLGEPVPEENLWTLWCKRRLTEADTH